MAIPYLTPCPYCENTHPKLTEFYTREKKDQQRQVYCEECRLASPTALNEEGAVYAWNRLVSIIRAAKSTNIGLPGGGPLSIDIYIRGRA